MNLLFARVCAFGTSCLNTHLRSRRVQNVDLPVRSPVPFDVSPKVELHSIFANLDIVPRQAEVIGHNLELSAGLHFQKGTVAFWKRYAGITGTNDMALEGKDQHCLKTVSRKIYQSL